MFHFRQHPPIPEICTDIQVYEKGWVIKHIKAGGIWQNMSLQTVIIVITVKKSGWQNGAEYHYNIAHKYFAKNAIPPRQKFSFNNGV